MPWLASWLLPSLLGGFAFGGLTPRLCPGASFVVARRGFCHWRSDPWSSVVSLRVRPSAEALGAGLASLSFACCVVSRFLSDSDAPMVHSPDPLKNGVVPVVSLLGV